MEQTVSDLLGADHESLATLLSELQIELRKHVPARAFDLLDLFWARLAMHIRAENLYLFPAIVRAVPSHNVAGMPTIDEVKSAVDKLRSDHNFFMDQLSKAVKTMREVTLAGEKSTAFAGQFEAIRDRVNAVTTRLIAHNELEEEQVYRWAALILGRPELESLSMALKRELENMPPRFAQS